MRRDRHLAGGTSAAGSPRGVVHAVGAGATL